MGRAKIMIVDDSELVLDSVARLLRDAGYEVVTRAVAVGASAAILRERPHLVLMNVSMPLLSGPEIADSLRSSSVPSSSTIVLFSGLPAEELEGLVKSCGAAGFIRKTSSRSELLAEVARFLGGSSPRAVAAIGPAPEIVVAGTAETAGWARRVLRGHAVVRCASSGFDALSIAGGRTAPDAMVIGSTLKDPPAIDLWERAARMDPRWARRMVLVDEPGHELESAPPGARRWSSKEPLQVLLDRLEIAAAR